MRVRSTSHDVGFIAEIKHHVYNKRNAAFINKMFTRATIAAMDDTMTRLYQAARERLGLTSPTEVAKHLNQFPQTLKNWEKRGISHVGLVLAEELIGCSATWLRTGKEADNTVTAGETAVAPGEQHAVQLVTWPFSRIPWPRVMRLPADELAFVEAKLEVELDRAEERLAKKRDEPQMRENGKRFDVSAKDEDYLLSGSPPNRSKRKRAG
ncbi:hypothetical protein [Ralstonia pseudosolanacearum]|uniref:hypothetical protein n=1 Tax=Ralstonia pseudosolanacearum TaxID=1310165 RepID=UPI001C8C250B|nr:hypothetical protein [Ralstonia pseudosolanacearum]MBX9427939.1 hypothetical protein [Ralstonia pseudosolanacearum]